MILFKVGSPKLSTCRTHNMAVRISFNLSRFHKVLTLFTRFKRVFPSDFHPISLQLTAEEHPMVVFKSSLFFFVFFLAVISYLFYSSVFFFPRKWILWTIIISYFLACYYIIMIASIRISNNLQPPPRFLLSFLVRILKYHLR